MELVVATLAILAIFQLFQFPGRQQDKKAREALDLITAPAEAPTEQRLKLLIDEPEDEGTFHAVTPVNAYSAAVAAVEAVASVVEAVPVAEVEAVLVDDVALLLDAVAVPNERVAAEDAAIARSVAPVAVISAEPAEAVPPAKKPRTAPVSRRDEVFALLDVAVQEGISSYVELAAYVKEHSGQGTSRTTIKAWKEARASAPMAEAIAHG